MDKKGIAMGLGDKVKVLVPQLEAQAFITEPGNRDWVSIIECISGGQSGSHSGGQSGSRSGGQLGSQSGGQSGGQLGGQSGSQSGGQLGGQLGGQYQLPPYLIFQGKQMQ